ncbi:unnamed protein product [Amoebophrya sp. A25]|nr:unnamed protein product [Amoebophrya sp. A25]|eukprot:GSA25T00022413001.1
MWLKKLLHCLGTPLRWHIKAIYAMFRALGNTRAKCYPVRGKQNVCNLMLTAFVVSVLLLSELFAISLGLACCFRACSTTSMARTTRSTPAGGGGGSTTSSITTRSTPVSGGSTTSSTLELDRRLAAAMTRRSFSRSSSGSAVERDDSHQEVDSLRAAAQYLVPPTTTTARSTAEILPDGEMQFDSFAPSRGRFITSATFLQPEQQNQNTDGRGRHSSTGASSSSAPALAVAASTSSRTQAAPSIFASARSAHSHSAAHSVPARGLDLEYSTAFGPQLGELAVLTFAGIFGFLLLLGLALLFFAFRSRRKDGKSNIVGAGGLIEIDNRAVEEGTASSKKVVDFTMKPRYEGGTSTNTTESAEEDPFVVEGCDFLFRNLSSSSSSSKSKSARSQTKQELWAEAFFNPKIGCWECNFENLGKESTFVLWPTLTAHSTQHLVSKDVFLAHDHMRQMQEKQDGGGRSLEKLQQERQVELRDDEASLQQERHLGNLQQERHQAGANDGFVRMHDGSLQLLRGKNREAASGATSSLEEKAPQIDDQEQDYVLSTTDTDTTTDHATSSKMRGEVGEETAGTPIATPSSTSTRDSSDEQVSSSTTFLAKAPGSPYLLPWNIRASVEESSKHVGRWKKNNYLCMDLLNKHNQVMGAKRFLGTTGSKDAKNGAGALVRVKDKIDAVTALIFMAGAADHNGAVLDGLDMFWHLFRLKQSLEHLYPKHYHLIYVERLECATDLLHFFNASKSGEKLLKNLVYLEMRLHGHEDLMVVDKFINIRELRSGGPTCLEPRLLLPTPQEPRPTTTQPFASMNRENKGVALQERRDLFEGAVRVQRAAIGGTFLERMSCCIPRSITEKYFKLVSSSLASIATAVGGASDVELFSSVRGALSSLFLGDEPNVDEPKLSDDESSTDGASSTASSGSEEDKESSLDYVDADDLKESIRSRPEGEAPVAQQEASSATEQDPHLHVTRQSHNMSIAIGIDKNSDSCDKKQNINTLPRFVRGVRPLNRRDLFFRDMHKADLYASKENDAAGQKLRISERRHDVRREEVLDESETLQDLLRDEHNYSFSGGENKVNTQQKRRELRYTSAIQEQRREGRFSSVRHSSVSEQVRHSLTGWTPKQVREDSEVIKSSVFCCCIRGRDRRYFPHAEELAAQHLAIPSTQRRHSYRIHGSLIERLNSTCLFEDDELRFDEAHDSVRLQEGHQGDHAPEGGKEKRTKTRSASTAEACLLSSLYLYHEDVDDPWSSSSFSRGKRRTN